MGRWFTWVIVAGVGGLLLIAGVDSLRSSGDTGASATAVATTAETPTTESGSGFLLPCRMEDLTLSIEVRGGRPTIVARNTGEECYQLLRGWHLRVGHEADDMSVEWDEIGLLADGIFPAGAERIGAFPRKAIQCKSPGPYHVSATVGPYFARLGHLSARQIACVGARA